MGSDQGKCSVLKAINTLYKGFYFRSRLEARYAIFMDNLGIEWVYELEGYQLENGFYLPDFYLPTFNGGSFAEVKFKFNEKEIDLCEELCEKSKKDVILWEGIPSYKVYNYFHYIDDDVAYKFCGIPNADSAEHENRMFTEPCYENADGTIPENMYDNLGWSFKYAVYMANIARFEYEDKKI